MIRPCPFGDPTTVDQLQEQGFVVLEAGVPDLLPAARALAERHLGRPGSFTSTARDAGPDDRTQLSREVRTLLGPAIQRALGRPVHVFLGAVLDKGPGAPALPSHQDLTYTREPDARSWTCWMPLVDLGGDDGALTVVAGSHRWTEHLRPSGPGGGYHAPRLEAELGRRADTIASPAGSIVIWDNALFHGSRPNRTVRRRPVLAATFADPGVELVVFHADDQGVTGHRIEGDLLAQERPFLSRPEGLAPVEPWAPLVREESFAAVIDPDAGS